MKEKKGWKWWQTLLVIWFFTGLIELHFGAVWGFFGNMLMFAIVNGAIQMIEAVLIALLAMTSDNSDN